MFLVGDNVFVSSKRRRDDKVYRVTDETWPTTLFTVEAICENRVWLRKRNSNQVGSEQVSSRKCLVTAEDADSNQIHRNWNAPNNLPNENSVRSTLNNNVDLRANRAEFFNNRGVLWVRRGNYANALKEYAEAIRIDPNYARAFNNRGLALSNCGQYSLAISDFTHAIRRSPNYASPYHNRGITYYRLRKYDYAVRDYDSTIRLDPENSSAYNNKGLCLFLKGDYRNAIAEYTTAIRLSSESSQAYNNRGATWAYVGQFDRAIADYREAIVLDPKYASAYNNLAQLLATCADTRFRDKQKSVELAKKACELTGWNNSSHMKTLAIAHAQSGNFQLATEYHSKAIKLCS